MNPDIKEDLGKTGGLPSDYNLDFCSYAYLIPEIRNPYSNDISIGCKIVEKNSDAKRGSLVTLCGMCKGVEITFMPIKEGEKGVRAKLTFNKEKTGYCLDNPNIIRN